MRSCITRPDNLCSQKLMSYEFRFWRFFSRQVHMRANISNENCNPRSVYVSLQYNCVQNVGSFIIVVRYVQLQRMERVRFFNRLCIHGAVFKCCNGASDAEVAARAEDCQSCPATANYIARHVISLIAPLENISRSTYCRLQNSCPVASKVKVK